MNLQKQPTTSGNSNSKGILSILRNIFQAIWNGVACVFKWIYAFLKKIWKWLLGLAILVAMVAGGIEAYNYYHYTYIPEKLLEEATNDVITKYQSLEGDAKYDFSCDILDKEQEWGYEGVSDEKLSAEISQLREVAFKYIEDLAYAGDPKSQYFLGNLYHFGDKNYHYVKSNPDKAAYWWNESASQGYINAYNNLGIAYKNGVGVKVDMYKAVKYLKMGAEAGEDYAQSNYGDLFLEGVKVRNGSHKETVKSSNYSYPGGVKIRQYYDDNLMDFVYVYQITVDDYKTLVPKDIEKAKYWWKKAAAQGNESAKNRLQKVYE
jgi:TPR repeat protein